MLVELGRQEGAVCSRHTLFSSGGEVQVESVPSVPELSSARSSGITRSMAGEASALVLLTQQLPAAQQAVVTAVQDAVGAYHDSKRVRAGVWAAALAAAAIFLQAPVANAVALVSGAVSLLLYGAVLVVVLAVGLDQLLRAEQDATAAPHAPPPEARALVLPARLSDEHRKTPEELLRQRWRLPDPVVNCLGAPAWQRNFRTALTHPLLTPQAPWCTTSAGTLWTPGSSPVRAP